MIMKKLLVIASILVLALTSYHSLYAQRGYEGTLEVIGGVSDNESCTNSFGLTTVHGYRFNPYLFLGASVGYKTMNLLSLKVQEAYGTSYHLPEENEYDRNHAFLLGARAKVNILNRKTSPFVCFDIGYDFDDSSVYYEPAVGVDIKVLKENALYIMLGYQHMTVWYTVQRLCEFEDVDGNKTFLPCDNGLFDNVCNILNIKIGIRF